jgi:hypothetical protein
VLSAHSHFAFGGWVGLALMTLLIYNLLPAQIHQKKLYQGILAGIEISSLGMALCFPIEGYNTIAIIFSSAYIVMTYIFGWFFIKDAGRLMLDKTVKLLAISAVVFLLLSAIGPLGLSYILVTGKGDAYLYRDSIYTFLHLQYNGFFTLSVLALFSNYLLSKNISITKTFRQFGLFVVLSVPPSLFLSLLWHNKAWFYVVAAAGTALLLLSLYLFLRAFISIPVKKLFTSTIAYAFFLFWIFSFSLKMLLNAGTIIPQLSNAVYGDRPIIIGFLHLVFLAFVTFYILSTLVEEGVYQIKRLTSRIPLYIFATGIFGNEIFLMVQGLGILFKFNSGLYQWLLWFAAILLFTGALLMAIAFYKQRSRSVAAASSILQN